MKKNTLLLNKCAYLFDDTYYKYFYGTKAQYERREAIQKELKTYYDDKEKRNTPIEYTKEIVTGWNDEKIERYYIIINGEKHGLNAAQIKYIADDTNNIINNRRHREFDNFNHANFRTIIYKDCSIAYSNKFKSLFIECFTNPDSLNYYRANFKGHSYRFIIDDRNGDLYSADGIQYKKITRNNIIECLEIGSENARKEFNVFIDYLVS